MLKSFFKRWSIKPQAINTLHEIIAINGADQEVQRTLIQGVDDRGEAGTKCSLPLLLETHIIVDFICRDDCRHQEQRCQK